MTARALILPGSLLAVPAAALAALLLWSPPAPAETAVDLPGGSASQWRNTDFSKRAVDMDEILWGGVPKDGIPPIDDPVYGSVDDAREAGLAPTEPVVSVGVNGDWRAYPLRVLTRHEIVNTEIGGQPVTVTYCPLCNSAVVFDRRLDGTVYDFGVSGFLRNSDLIMWDRQTESWWQQFTGRAIVGEMTGAELDMLPMRMESFENFAERAPGDAKVLVTGRGLRAYGANPYEGYDTAQRPFLYDGPPPPGGLPPLERVAAVDDTAWTFDYLKHRRRVEHGDLVITWEPGQNSALNTRLIAEGRDVGNVVVQRKTEDGLEDVVHDITFVFAFHAFNPEGTIHTVDGPVRLATGE